MLISWDGDDGEDECGPDHADCAYGRAYPGQVLVRVRGLGLLRGHSHMMSASASALRVWGVALKQNVLREVNQSNLQTRGGKKF